MSKDEDRTFIQKLEGNDYSSNNHIYHYKTSLTDEYLIKTAADYFKLKCKEKANVKIVGGSSLLKRPDVSWED